MLKYNFIKHILSLCLLATAALFAACDDDEDDANAIVELKSFGPSVLRGGELKFIGANLGQVQAIILPENVEIPAASFKTHTATLIVIDVPDEATAGLVTLKTPSGDVVTKTRLGILEPITIESISPNPVRPGSVVTITGTYLNLISVVEFGGLQETSEFESQTRTTLTVKVPDAALTAPLLLYDSEEVPNVIQSEEALSVVLPVSESLSPNPVKAGSSLTISGTDLDLAVAVAFAGNERVDSADFISVTDTEIVLTTPSGADDGPIELIAVSGGKTESTVSLTMVVPTIATVTGVGPNVAKSNGIVTVSGTDLDLITGVRFGGDKQAGVEDGGTDTQITVKVPADATDGMLEFLTAANKSVPSPAALELVKPVITSFTPAIVHTKDDPSITINGSDLDVVNRIIFGGGWEAEVTGATATQITIPVTPGSLTGTFTLITTNDTEVESADPLTIVPNVPEVTGPNHATLGSMLTLTGTNMDVIADVYFPGGLIATRFGAKSATKIEVFVPETGVTSGPGKIKFVTYKNEVYYSPEMEFAGIAPLGIVLYDEAIAGGGGDWSWEKVVSDPASTEQFYSGAVSWKYETGNGGGLSAGGIAAVDASGMTYFSFSLYGGPGTDQVKVACILNDNWGDYKDVTLAEGKWTHFQIPLAGYATTDLSAIVRFTFKVEGMSSSVIYADRVGFE